ncbi:MAG: acyltransferase [Chitinophagales bacterium]|nr:acyltransferase [Chitinophagales bacterium]
MIHQIINRIVQLKNPHFKLHPEASTRMLMQLAFVKMKALLRGQTLWLRGKQPGLIFLEKGVSFFNISKIQLGKWVQLDEKVQLSAWGTSGIQLGNNVHIGAYSRLITSTNFSLPGKGIKIGKHVGIGEYAYLGGAGGLEIGDDCIIGQYFSCHPENHCYAIGDIPFRLQGVNRKGIQIGKNCWIGSKVTILDGVHIGDNCVIAAGAVVTKNIPANSVAGGVPARILKSVPHRVYPQTQQINRRLCTSELY